MTPASPNGPHESAQETLQHKGFIDDIQLMRGLAILSVLAYHLSFPNTVINSLPGKLTNPFYSGVDLFFIISGFVVMRSLMRGGFDPAIFAIRRGFRLYPALLAFLVAALVVNVFYLYFAPIPWASDYFTVSWGKFTQMALGVLGGYFINLPNAWGYSFGAVWSLSVEFQFYAALFILMVILRTTRIGKETFPLVFLFAAVGVTAFCLQARIASLFRHLGNVEEYLVNRRFDFMTLGVVLAHVPQASLQNWARRRPSWTLPLLLIVTWGVLALCRDPRTPPGLPDGWTGAGMVVAAAAFTFCVALAAGGETSTMLPGALRRVLLWTGDRSYSIYLLHFPCMALAWFVIYELSPAGAANEWQYGPLQIVFFTLLIVPAAELSFRLVEEPAVALGARGIKRAKQR